MSSTRVRDYITPRWRKRILNVIGVTKVIDRQLMHLTFSHKLRSTAVGVGQYFHTPQSLGREKNSSKTIEVHVDQLIRILDIPEASSVPLESA